MILRLPAGYETEIGEAGALLSGGQKQLIGLARALFRNPRLVVLDEPNANLDAEGERALLRALETLKARRTTVILVTHQFRLVPSVDKVLVLRDGNVEVFGPREDVLRQPLKPVARTAPGGSSVTLVARPANRGEPGRT
jgi:ABC-type protease/lipase transport system fused ATPase/permease subunit